MGKTTTVPEHIRTAPDPAMSGSADRRSAQRVSGARPPGGALVKGTELSERYHRLVELAPDGILIHDGERIIMANAAAVRLAGATGREQLLGRPIDAFLNPPHLKGLQERLIEAGEPMGTAPTIRDAFRRLDGSLVEVEVTAIPYLDCGRPAAHLVIRDVTERLAAQAAALRAEADKMATVRTLAGGVAHEVNNMMLVVLGYAEFLTREQTLPEGMRQNAVEIQRAAGRAAAVAQQLLAFSRRAVRHPRAVGLDELVRGMVPALRSLLRAGQELRTVLACSGRIWVDEGQLAQVITNLALNARDAMPSGGELTLTTDEFVLEGELTDHASVLLPPGRYGRLRLHDTGMGMDSATLARLFEPFFTTKGVGQGTGLGLSVLDGIMEQNGGYVRVQSAPGKGATFALYFPLLTGADVPGESAVPAPIARDAVRGGTILIVDDEPAVRQLTAEMLEARGFQVRMAADAATALELVKRGQPPDVVLTDLTLPGMDGAELARRLRAARPHLPVLLMSGYSEEYLRREDLLDFEGVVLQKPFRPEQLVDAIEGARTAR